MKGLYTLLFFIVLITGPGVAGADSTTSERLWLSFLGKWGDYYVMLIDAGGNVIASPQQVLSFQETIAADEIIVFQALDSNGHIVGPRKILTEMPVGGADLLREVLQSGAS